MLRQKQMPLKLISLFVIGIHLYALTAQADCDFSTGITKVDNGYLYTPECHKKVGKVVADLKDREDQVSKLTQVIDLKDLSIGIQEKRADLWMNTSLKLEDRVNTIERYNDTSKVLYFVGGVVLTGLAVWGAGQLR